MEKFIRIPNSQMDYHYTMDYLKEGNNFAQAEGNPKVIYCYRAGKFRQILDGENNAIIYDLNDWSLALELAIFVQVKLI